MIKEEELKFEVVEDEDRIIILLNNKKENIGKITLEIRDIYYFNEYEIDGLIEEQGDTLKKNEIYHLENLSEKLSDKQLIFYYESLNINKEFRRMGYRTKMMNFSVDLLKEKSKDMNNFSYINAFPSFEENRISLEKLSKFYKKFGFKTMLKQQNNISLVCEDIFDLKTVKIKKEKNLKSIKEIKSENYTLNY